MSTQFLFTNFAESALVEEIDQLAAVIRVDPADYALFPSPAGDQRAAAVLHDGDADHAPEIVYITTNNGDGSFDVLRGQEGTIARTWLAGSMFFCSLTAEAIANNAMYWLPAGMVQWYAGSTPPTGWLECNGAAVNRTTYATLFAALGTTFGVGDGSTTFNLPDLRGEFIRGYDHGRGVDSGRAFGSNQADALEAHIHELAVGDAATPNVDLVSLESATATTPVDTESTGDSETRPRNVALLPCIKY